MKRFKIFAASLIFMILFSQVEAQSKLHYERTQSGRLIPFAHFDTATTTSATPLIMDTVAITNNTAGILEVTVVGASAVGDGITGKLIYRYHKAAGTLTVATADTASAVTADTGLSGGTFALAANSFGNAKLTVTGKASTTVVWHSRIEPKR